MNKVKRELNENASAEKITYFIFSEYRSALMGLAILSIMIFHYTEDCLSQGTLSGWVYWYYYYIRSSSVDAFVFLSGFGLYFSLKKQPDIGFFYKKRFIRLIIPYSLIAIPALIWQDLYINDEGIIYLIKDFFFVLFFQEGNDWFWYILLSYICYFIFPYVFSIFESAQDRITEQMYMMSIFSFFTVICLMFQSNQTEFFEKVQIAFLRFPVFFFGCMIGKAAYERRRISKNMWALMLLSMLLLPLAEDSKIIVVRYVLAFFNLSLCMLFALAMKKLSRLSKFHNGIKAVLEWLGRYSLELYLAHVALRRVMREYEYYTYQEENELFMLAIAFVVALIIKKITDIILKLFQGVGSQ